VRTAASLLAMFRQDASVSPHAGTAPTHVMTVSGRVVFDAFGRTIRQFYPVTEALGQQSMFNATFDAVAPTVTTFDILDRVTQVTIRTTPRRPALMTSAPTAAGRPGSAPRSSTPITCATSSSATSARRSPRSTSSTSQTQDVGRCRFRRRHS
jgi:hypothetical protein